MSVRWSGDDRLPDRWVEYDGEPDEPESDCPAGLINLIVEAVARRRVDESQ